jgi:hypothetical protein
MDSKVRDQKQRAKTDEEKTGFPDEQTYITTTQYGIC